MPWIKSTYRPTVTDGNEPQPIHINLDQVRSIRRTAGGKVRINWATRGYDPMILDEDYAEFIKRWPEG